jgi:hypothetical protein
LLNPQFHFSRPGGVFVHLIEAIDPFIMQVMIVPIVVIGLGTIAAAAAKKIYIGPIVTLVITLIYNGWYFSHMFAGVRIPIAMIFSWCIMFPFFSLVLSWAFVSFKDSLKVFFLLIAKEKNFCSK